MKFLVEESKDIELLFEGTGDKKDLYIHGIFMQADVANRNKRVYPGDIMEKEVNRYIKESIKTQRAVGEFSHPPTPTITMDRISHLITEMKMEGSNVIGKAKVLNTPMGQIARGLLEGGVSLGVSSRGLGSVKKQSNGIMEVCNDFKLVTVDMVNDPSAPGAFVNALMEDADWIYDASNDTWAKASIPPLQEAITKNKNTLTEEQKLGVFNKFIQSLSKSYKPNK